MTDARRESDRPTLADLDREAVVTPSDRAIAPRFWAAYGTLLLRALLKAVRRRDGN